MSGTSRPYNQPVTAEQYDKARAALEERRKKQELAHATLLARQNPTVRALLDDAFTHLGLLDPEQHLRAAIARYPLDVIVDGIAIAEELLRARLDGLTPVISRRTPASTVTLPPRDCALDPRHRATIEVWRSMHRARLVRLVGASAIASACAASGPPKTEVGYAAIGSAATAPVPLPSRANDAAGVEERVRVLAVKDLPCAPAEIAVVLGSLSVVPGDDTLYNAEGCGRRIVYVHRTKGDKVEREDGSWYAPR